MRVQNLQKQIRNFFSKGGGGRSWIGLVFIGKPYIKKAALFNRKIPFIYLSTDLHGLNSRGPQGVFRDYASPLRCLISVEFYPGF